MKSQDGDPSRSEAPLDRAVAVLDGLSVGDALGDQFFINPAQVDQAIHERWLPRAPWPWTDDTNMALSVLEVLVEHGCVEQDALAASFAARYSFARGYGPSMHRVLRKIGDGQHWREVTRAEFGGQGSYGNGAAMRVAPLGAWFAEDLALVANEAHRSAVVTHAHPEASAGAVAVAVATAIAWQSRAQPASAVDLLERVRPYVPNSEVAERLRHAAELPPTATVRLAAAALGTGQQISAQDTVPFALWAASRHLDEFQETFWETLSGLGDRDTTCAIACSIVAGRVGRPGIPEEWVQGREPLPAWARASPH